MARARTTSDGFNAVAEPRRREILSYLAGAEKPVLAIVAALGMEQPAVSKHLRVLKDVGLVRMRCQGRQKLYQTNAEAIKPLHAWAATFERYWQHQLVGVKARAEAMARAATDLSVESLTLTINQEIHVEASIEITFSALLEQLGPGNETMDGKSLSMKLEAWPGGRWYRDMGDGNGHFWANVKAIMRPTLLEFVGPLFASFPLMSNVQYRLKEVEGGTLIVFRHSGLGFVREEMRAGTVKGWGAVHERVKRDAEGKSLGTRG